MEEYDFAVIGGGSGGLAAAKEAAALGAKTVLFDYVSPSPKGTKWGFGGTCVNVGCIPKKLFHFTGLTGEAIHDAITMGWELGEPKFHHNWATTVEKVTNYIRQLNFSYRTGLRSSKVTYFNAWASLNPENPKQVIYTDSQGQKKSISAKFVCIAVGGRPTYPDLPNARELAITSDDIFYMKKAPGKTLVVGGGYIAMECAGFLTSLGYDTTLAVRSRPLRAFDAQAADKIVQVMTELGTNFRLGVNPVSLDSAGDKISVKFDDGSADIFDTVLLATGRTPETKKLNIPGHDVLPSGKIPVDADMQLIHTRGVFAIGDAVEGRPELTPVAIKDGELLARRLFAGATKRLDHPELIPTTVFTPVEYGVVGLSEEEAVKEFGRDLIDSYLWEWQTLERAVVHRPKLERLRADVSDADQGPHNLCKLIIRKDTELVLGFHFVGPNAGEVLQGFAVAMRLGMKKGDVDDTLGIHPTDAEALVNLTVTKSSGESYTASGGCGGGRCG